VVVFQHGLVVTTPPVEVVVVQVVVVQVLPVARVLNRVRVGSLLV
jgi:hypothetical protein